jgi:hypothetical protein
MKKILFNYHTFLILSVSNKMCYIEDIFLLWKASLNCQGHLKAVFPLARFIRWKYNKMWQSLLYLTTWQPWAMQHRKDHFYFILCCPGWPRQIQQQLWHVTVTNGFANKPRQCKWSIWDATQIEMIISVSRHPRWPGQVNSLLCVSNVCCCWVHFCPKIAQYKLAFKMH